MDFEGRPWQAIAIWLVAAEVALWLLSRLVDAVWFPQTSCGFFEAMLAFAGYVFLDAR